MPDIPAVPGASELTLAHRVDRAFDRDGVVARAIEGFEARAGQRRLAAEVSRLFEAGGTLVAEAGTGTGKTLAYLLPAVLSGRRVLISTGTRTLQDQIFYKDIPALSRAIGREIRAAYMKGRSNYLCLHRYERLGEAEAGLPADERRWFHRIAEWAAATTTGDRAEIEELPDEFPLWAELSATSEQCLGRECPRFADCHITRMRERAAEADLVIVNHHLLCADASVRQGAFGEVIPACDLAVIDEAHQLEDVVTQYFGVALGTHRIDDFCRDGQRALGGLAGGADGRLESALGDALDRLPHAARRLFDAARAEQMRSSEPRPIVTAAIADRLREAGTDLADTVDRMAGRIRAAADVPEEVAAIGARAASLAADLTVLLAADDERFVHFIEARGRGVVLRAAPIDVAEIVRDTVLGGRSATVLTSATLTVESSFAYAVGRLGVAGAKTIRLPSEFDFTSQALLYLPPEMPDPRAPEFNRAAAWIIAELLDRTRGRAFVLFTSHGAMREVFGLVEPRVGWPLLMQGTASRTALLRDFRATPHAVLFATSSFWQGVDVAGDALSAVIIDRLPFASPADPLVAARIQAVRSRGGDAFNEYQVPLATLTLLQGLGRLIRTGTDRGVLAVLDPRLTGKSYGRKFLASLPPAPITDDLHRVGRFFDSED